MADAREYVGELRRIADEIEHMKPGSAWVCREAATLIERLTPKPMTLAEACDVLNAKNHRYSYRWQVSHVTGSDGEPIVDSIQGSFTAFEAEAIARAYEAQKEAARA